MKRGFIVLRHRDDDRFFKGGGNHRGSKVLIKDGCKQTSKLISAGPQNTTSNPIRLKIVRLAEEVSCMLFYVMLFHDLIVIQHRQ